MKRYLVCGGTSGIGQSFVRSLSGKDCGLCLIARNEEKARQLIKDLDFAECLIVKADLNEAFQLAPLVEKILLEGFIPDAVLYSAGIDLPMTVRKSDPVQASMIMQVNFMSFAMLVRALLRRHGLKTALRILAISSKNVTRPLSANAFYAASKGALEAFVKSTACEVSSTNFFINALRLGWVDTPMAWNSPAAKAHEDFEKWLREGMQARGLIPVADVVSKIYEYLDGKNSASGIIEEFA